MLTRRGRRIRRWIRELWRRIEQSQHAQRCDQHRDQAHSAQPPRSRDRHIFTSSLRPPPRDRPASQPFHFRSPSSSRNYSSNLSMPRQHRSSRFDPRLGILRARGIPPPLRWTIEDLFCGKERKKERKKEGEKYSPSSSVWPRIGLDSGQTRRRRDAKAGSV